jgi:hypothetical protein
VPSCLRATFVVPDLLRLAASHSSAAPPASGLASGVYVMRVVGERFSGTRRVTVVR